MNTLELAKFKIYEILKFLLFHIIITQRFLFYLLCLTCTGLYLYFLVLGRAFIFDYMLYNASSIEIYNQSTKLCATIVRLPYPFSQIKIFSVTMSILIILIYIIVPKKSNCMHARTICKKIFTMPKIQNSFRRDNRVNTACTFAVIAFQVIDTTIAKLETVDHALDTTDILGLTGLVIQIMSVILVGVRYYPLLMAFANESLFLYVLVTFYAWIDLTLQVYYEAFCNTAIYTASGFGLSKSEKSKVIYIIYISIYMLPNLLIYSYINIRLSFNTIKYLFGCLVKKKSVNSEFDYLIDKTLNYSDLLIRMAEQFKGKNSFYCAADVEYCKKLFSSLKEVTLSNDDNNKNPINIKKDDFLLNALCKKLFAGLKKFFKNYFYDSANHFRFSLRFVSTQVVCLIVVYCISALLFMVNFGFVEDALFISNMTNSDSVKFSSASILCKTRFIQFICSNDGKLFGLLEPKQDVNIIFELWMFLILPMAISVTNSITQIVIGIYNYKRDYLLLCSGKSYHITNKRFITKENIGVSFFFFFNCT
jgi:hypothetical protein